VKAFPEARGSLIYFFSFRKSRRLRPLGRPPSCMCNILPAILTHYSVTYLILLTCRRVDKVTKWQNLVKLNFGRAISVLPTPRIIASRQIAAACQACVWWSQKQAINQQLFRAGKSNMINPASAATDARCGYFVRAIVGFRGVRIDTRRASDDRNWPVLDVFARVTKYLIGSPIGWRRVLQALSHGDSTIPPWFHHHVGTL
jgi:hypothetical protein